MPQKTALLKENGNRFIHKPTLLAVLVIVSLIISSCRDIKNNHDSSKDKMSLSSTSNRQDEPAKESIDIPVYISLTHTADEDMKQLVDAEYEVTKESEYDMYIDINSDYYKKYMSGTRFHTKQLAFFENSENTEYLTMNLDIVNNTTEKLSINELNVIVDESELDTIPQIYICTTMDYSNCIYFVNQSWFNWKGATFSYSILKKGETFNGNYNKTQYIPFFDKYIIVDLLPDMKEMGYNFDDLVNSIREKNIKRLQEQNIIGLDTEPISQTETESFLCFSIGDNDDDFQFFQEKFKPFELKKDDFDEYVGEATLYGSLKFDNINFSVDFIAKISLSTSAGFGAISYENDNFNVQLNAQGNDYTLRFPYTTVIEPYGAENIKLTIAADKSSMHKFHIDIKNDNGLTIRSKNVHFHHYYPKN